MVALSADLRERILVSVDEGEEIDFVSARYGVSRRTLYYWLARRRDGVEFVKKSGRKVGFCPVIDEEKLKASVEEEPDMYGYGRASLLGCGVSSISAALKRLGLTRKKSPAFTENQARKSAKNMQRN
jgi:transposase